MYLMLSFIQSNVSSFFQLLITISLVPAIKNTYFPIFFINSFSKIILLYWIVFIPLIPKLFTLYPWNISIPQLSKIECPIRVISSTLLNFSFFSSILFSIFFNNCFSFCFILINKIANSKSNLSSISIESALFIK